MSDMSEQNEALKAQIENLGLSPAMAAAIVDRPGRLDRERCRKITAAIWRDPLMEGRTVDTDLAEKMTYLLYQEYG